jgi:hypothetical protein
VGGPPISAAEAAKTLEQVEIDLSLMIAQDRAQWNLSGLRDRAQAIVERGEDPATRGRGRIVLDKIQQFETAFGADTGRPTSRVPRSTATSAGSDKTLKSEPADRSLADPRYDAQGWLKPVISRKGDKPAAPFAVVDGDGQPVAFISPSPGLNLNRYVNKQIGLYGRRGFLEELKKPHVLAERVIELDTHLR